MRAAIQRTLLWAIATLAIAALLLVALITYPDPLFAFSLDSGKISVASDRPIPPESGQRFLRECERLLDRSPLKAEGRRYRLYVTNENWRQRLFFFPNPERWGFAWYYGFGSHAFVSGADFDSGRVIHQGYIGTPPRTLAYLCGHELTHNIAWEHVGLDRLHVPQWVWEGLADYVGIENRETFEQLRTALGDRPDSNAQRVAHGSYPHYRLLVTYFIEQKGWPVDQLLKTRLSENEANDIMRTGEKR